MRRQARQRGSITVIALLFFLLLVLLAGIAIGLRLLWNAFDRKMEAVHVSWDVRGKHAAAETEAARGQLEAAGEAILATDIWHGTGVFMGGILLQCGAVLISAIMLRSDVFSRTIAYVGIVTHGLDLAHIVLGVFLPALGVVLMAVAGPLYLIWFPLVGRRLLQLGRGGPSTAVLRREPLTRTG